MIKEFPVMTLGATSVCLLCISAFLQACAPGGETGKGGYTGGDPDAGYSSMEIAFLDVGQGDSVLIELPGGEVVLIDGGDEGKGEDVVVPALEERGLSRIDLLVMTHPHADHCGGLDEVMEAVEVSEIWENGEENDTYSYRGYDEAADLSGALRLAPLKGHSESFGDVTLRVLHTDAGYEDFNNDSLVIEIEYEEITVLTTGDVEREAQQQILSEYGSALACDLLKVPHHGSSDFEESFVAYTAPSAAVISCGTGNDYGHPHHEALEAYEHADVNLCRTDQHGTITFTIDGQDLQGGCD